MARITTKVTFDIETGECLHRESYEYHGPIEHLGKLFANLTQSGVTDPTTGQTTFQNSPAATGQALAASAARTAAPGRSDIIDPSVAGDGSESGTVINYGAPVTKQPTVVHPTFQQANATGGFLSPELSTKGKILSGIISAIQGAGAGAAAASQGSPRTGYPSPLVGLSAGFSVPYENAQRRNALVEQQLSQAIFCYPSSGFPTTKEAQGIAPATVKELHRCFRVLKRAAVFYHGANHGSVWDPPTFRFKMKGAK